MITILITFTFISLIILSITILLQKSIDQSVILFMGFGLGSTILFFLFSAPDVALTEAVIGAGISGFIFLSSIIQTLHKKRTNEQKSDDA